MKVKIFAEESSLRGFNRLERKVNRWLEQNKDNYEIKDKQTVINLTRLVITIWYVQIQGNPEPTPSPRPGRKE